MQKVVAFCNDLLFSADMPKKRKLQKSIWITDEAHKILDREKQRSGVPKARLVLDAVKRAYGCEGVI